MNAVSISDALSRDVTVAASENELQVRVAKLQSDVQHIQSDISDVKADVRELRGETRALRAELAKAKLWALGLYGSLLYVLAHGFKWL
jgi:peptidoglycan hydrolase CwlO-like protein